MARAVGQWAAASPRRTLTLTRPRWQLRTQSRRSISCAQTRHLGMTRARRQHRYLLGCPLRHRSLHRVPLAASFIAALGLGQELPSVPQLPR